jgi:hypothetical protein
MNLQSAVMRGCLKQCIMILLSCAGYPLHCHTVSGKRWSTRIIPQCLAAGIIFRHSVWQSLPVGGDPSGEVCNFMVCVLETFLQRIRPEDNLPVNRASMWDFAQQQQMTASSKCDGVANTDWFSTTQTSVYGSNGSLLGANQQLPGTVYGLAYGTDSCSR